MNDEEFRRRLADDMKELASEDTRRSHLAMAGRAALLLVSDFDDDQTFVRLKDLLTKLDAERKAGGNYFFYLATAPDYFAPVVEQLGSVD